MAADRRSTDKKPGGRRPQHRSEQRLDQPIEPRRLVPRPSYDPEAFGRFSERIARFLGTGRFLVYMTAFVLLWIGWNAVGPADLRWDPYAFIFLTLMLSLQASYAAPLILLAQNRQADRDRVNLEQDREVNLRNRADMEYLAREVAALRIALGEVATRDFLRSELRALLEDLDERADEQSGDGDGASGVPSVQLKAPAHPKASAHPTAPSTQLHTTGERAQR